MAAYVKANNTTNLNIASSWTANSGFPSSTNDTATWNSTVTGANTVSLGGAITAGTITIANPGGLVTLNAATTTTLTVGSGGFDLSSATQNLDINGPIQIALAANQPWSVASGRRLATGTEISGAYVITKNGTGLLQLNNSGTFSGIALNAGSVWVVASGAGLTTPIGSRTSTTAVTIANGGKLEFQANDVIATAVNINETNLPQITLNGNADNGTYLFATRYNGVGNVTLNSAWLVQASTDGGSFRGWQFIGTITSTGTSRISSNNSTPNHLNGIAPTTFNVTSGTLTIEASAPLIDASPAQAGAGALTKSGAGTLTVAAANTFTGAVSVSAGTLNANSATALGAASSTAGISVSSGATLSLGAALNYSSPGRSTSIIGTGVGSGGALVHAFAGTANVGAINLGGAAYIRGTATGNLSSTFALAANRLTAGAASGFSFTLSGTLTSTFPAGLTVGGQASDTGTVIVSGTNTLPGALFVNYGTLSTQSAQALGVTGSALNATVAANATLSIGVLATYTGALTLNGSVVVAHSGSTNLGTITSNANTAYVRGTVLNAALASPFSVISDLTFGAAASASLALTGVINSSASNVLVNIGQQAADTGTVFFNANNTYAGTTTLAYGTAQVVTNQNGSISGPLGKSGTIRFTGGTLQYSATNQFDYSPRLNTAGSQQWKIDTNGQSVTFASALQGAGSLVEKLGTGTLRFTGTNTYTGSTSVYAGTLAAGNTQAFGTTGTVTLTTSGATLQTLTTGGQNGKLTVAALTNSAGGTIKIGG